MHFKMLSAICINFDQSKILSSGNGLTILKVMNTLLQLLAKTLLLARVSNRRDLYKFYDRAIKMLDRQTDGWKGLAADSYIPHKTVLGV